MTISLGTLCSHTTWLAVVVMALVGFAILFAGVIDGYVAAASLVLILTFVIAAMVQADPGEIPARLAGWEVAGLLSIAAIFGLWPGRPPDQLRRGTATAIEALAAQLEAMAAARAAGPPSAAEVERLAGLSLAAYEATVAARNAFVAIPHRPSGVGGRTAALGRLIDDLDWFDALAREQPAPASVSAGFADERAALEAWRRRRSASPRTACAATIPATAAPSCAGCAMSTERSAAPSWRSSASTGSRTTRPASPPS